MIASPSAILDQLRAGHQRFLEGHSLHPHSDRSRILEVETGQHPIAAILGCADSRVPVELLFDTGFGDLFVVLGHAACGVVAAAFDRSLALTPSLAQVVGQLRMELFSLGAEEDLEASGGGGVLQPAHPQHGVDGHHAADAPGMKSPGDSGCRMCWFPGSSEQVIVVLELTGRRPATGIP